jgi:3',5'-cyclic AMP phosphodiesterase CpdA
VRLAHFSDIHVTQPPADGSFRAFLGKRLAATLHYYVGGRRHRFAEVDQRIRRLLSDVESLSVDHAICTGDVTMMALPAEFSRFAELFGERLDHPHRWTILPGNHDRYTKGSVRERRFERYVRRAGSPEGEYPFVKHLSDGVSLVGLDVSRACSVIDSSGLAGPRQLNATKEVLTDPSLSHRFVIVALHYPLLDPDGSPHRRRHGIRDWQALLAVLSEPAARVDLVVHGHVHDPYVVRSHQRTFVCAGSATDLSHAGYNVYEIDVERRAWTIERRLWNADREAYETERKVFIPVVG